MVNLNQDDKFGLNGQGRRRNAPVELREAMVDHERTGLDVGSNVVVV